MVGTMHINAQAGPSKLPRPTQPSSPTIETPSPLNAIDDEPIYQGSVGQGGQGGTGGAGGVSRNGLSVDENGEVTKVPAFLTKLYSMVSDQDTNELIYWSDNGDSFLIPNQELVAKRILPKFFKHSNFQSFVRQLNMYAFHKVPHTSAVPTGEAELWEFVNPLFKRGQPELLGRITRRQRVGAPGSVQPVTTAPATSASRGSGRQTQVISPGGSYHTMHLITDGTTQGESTPDPNHQPGSGGGGNSGLNMIVSPQGVLDLSAITSGIAAIQRTQASIGADLKALQASNEHLWREAMEQREKHKKHQETIDLIVSFLERLFGTDGEGLKGLKDAMRRAGMAGPGGGEGVGAGLEEIGPGGGGGRGKKRRLGVDRMISDGNEDAGKLVEISSSDKKSRFNDPFLPRPVRTRSAIAADPSSWPDPTSANRFQTLPSEGEPSPFSAGSTTPVPASAPRTAGTSVSSSSTDTAAGGAGGGLDSAIGEDDALALALAPYYRSATNQPHAQGSGGFNGTSGGQGFGASTSDRNNTDSIDPTMYRGMTDPGYANGLNQGLSNPNANPNPNSNSNFSIPPLSPATASAAQAYNLDPALLQTTIGSLLQSPAAAQMFLNSLKTSAQAQNLVGSGSGSGSFGVAGAKGGIGGYAPAPTSQHPSFSNQHHQSQGYSHAHSQYSDPTLALFNPLPGTPSTTATDLATLKTNQDALLRSYEDALGVGEDVEGLQRGIDELVRSMGLDVGGGAGAQVDSDRNGRTSQNGQMGRNIQAGFPSSGIQGDTSLDDIFGVGGGGGDDISGSHGPSVSRGGAGVGAGDLQGEDAEGDPGSELDIPDGFDVDEFLRELQEQQDGQDGQGAVG